MSEIYAEFDDDDNLEGNDEDIGALGSILSWDEDDDEAVGVSVAAISSALEQREGDSAVPTSVALPKESNSSYLPDLGGGSSQSIQMTGAIGYNTQPTGQQPQAPLQPQNLTVVQPQGTQQLVQPVPGTQPQVMFYQMQSFPTGTTTDSQQQQAVALPPGIALAPLPRQGTVQQPQEQQQTFNVADPNAFLRQMQQVQQQQFSTLQQPRPLAPQPAPLMPTLPQAQQTQQLVANPASNGGAAGATIPQMQKKKQTNQPPKPPQPTISGAQTVVQQPAAAVARAVNIVSCSDTDAESTSKTASATTSSEGKPDKKKASASAAARKGANAADKDPDTSNMSAAEKAKANRDRNREHARNTRLRKKAYLEKLKMTVDELCRERDTLVSERAGAANLLVEMHNTRTEVLMSFFALRSAYEKRRELWASILDESCFACVMPVTPYRSFPASEVQVSKCQRTILGIDGMMADTASLHVLLNSMIDRTRYPNASIAFRYTLVTEDAVVAGNQMMARWVMSTMNATQCGARMEVTKQGMLCCKFNSAHKITGLELMFDVMAFMLQLKQAAGTDTFSVVPNTVQTCQRSFETPMVMTLAERPYTIVQVNKLWEDMTGFKAEDVVGKASCQVLQGQETDRSAVEALMYAVRFKRPASCVLLNYSRSGKRFRNYMNVYPLSTDSKVTHYVALTSHVEQVDGSNGSTGASGTQALQPIASAPGEATQGSTSQPAVANQGQTQPTVPQPMVMPAAGQGVTITGVSTGLPSTSIVAKPTLVQPAGVPMFVPQPIVSMPTSTMAQVVPPQPVANTAATLAAPAPSKRPLDESPQQQPAQKVARLT